MKSARQRIIRRAAIAAIGAIAASAFLAGLAATADAARPRRPITLLAITDFHGALASGGQDRDTQRSWGGAIALGNAVRRARAASPDRCFLFDAGDEMQGTPASNLAFARPAVDILNRLGVDAAALGNHQFTTGMASGRGFKPPAPSRPNSCRCCLMS